MKIPNKSIRLSWILSVFLLIIALSGCAIITSPSNISPSPTTSPIAVEPTSNAPINSPPPLTPPKSSTLISLNPKGPWLVYPTSEGIKAANADGSGSILIAPTSLKEMVASEPDIPSGISPNGRLIAHRKDSANGTGWELELIHLPDLKTETITSLISANNLSTMASDQGQTMLLTSAILYDSPIQWSPDGRYLAFVAALDGPSSDLYVYDTVSKKIIHATSGELEVARPLWTLDGSEILYQVVTTFGTGAGWTTNGVRAVKPDGSGDRLIYRNPNGTGPETFLGVSQDNMALVDHFDPRGGGLYLVNLNSGELHLLSANYSSAAMDPVNGDYVFIDGDGKLNFSLKPDAQYKPVSELLFTNGKVYWDMQYVYFIVQAETVAGIDPFGNLVDFRGTPYMASDGHSICTVNYGIECDTQTGIFTIPDALDAVVYWVPDVSGFFYIINDKLEYVSLSQKHAVLVDEGLLPLQDLHQVLFAAGWMK